MSNPHANKLNWTEGELRRLATAWNSGVGLASLAHRFGVGKTTVANKLKEAVAVGINVIPHKEGE